MVCRLSLLILKFLHGENSIGSAETKTIRECQIDCGVIDAFLNDWIVANFGIKIFDVRGCGDEIMMHHQDGINCFMDTCGTLRMTGQRFGRGHRRQVLAGVNTWRMALISGISPAGVLVPWELM